MGRIMSAKHAAAASTALPALLWLALPGKLWSAALFIAWCAGAAAIWIATERRETERRLARTIESMQQASSRTLNHYRHDWMNDLQVLFGYARLGKLDKTIQFVEKIKDKMAAEGAVSKLGEPSLVSYLQSFRSMTNALRLEVEVEGELDLGKLPLEKKRIAEAIIHIIHIYRLGARPGADGLAVLKLSLKADNEALHVRFDYAGEMMNGQEWHDSLTQQLKHAALQLVEGGQPLEGLLLRAEMPA